MNKKLLWVLLLGLNSAAFGQDPVAQKYAAVINPADARKHLSILASDAFQGRETGTAGAEKAARYIANEFKKIGLKPAVNGSYFQNVPIIQHRTEVQSFVVNRLRFVHGRDFYFAGSPGDLDLSKKEIVFVGYGISSKNYDDLKDIDVKGKVVLVINKGEPTRNGISAVTRSEEASDWSTDGLKRIQYLESKQPALILATSPSVLAVLQAYPRYFTEGRMVLKNHFVQPPTTAVPVVNIAPNIANAILQPSGQTIERLKAQIDSTGTPSSGVIKADFSTRFATVNRQVPAVNVLGYLEGADLKNELVVFSAHYDHIGLNPAGPDKVNNGADDDGSGTTAIIEIARAYAKAKKEGHGPRRSILFLGNVGEEKGLLGSEWYTDNPVFPLQNTITDLNIDMIGRVDPQHKADTNYCYLVGSDKLSSTLHKISEQANATYTKFKIDYKYNDPGDPERIYYRSDHYNFAKHNIPIIFYFNGIHEDYHKPGDEVSKINFDLLARRAQLVFYTGWELLNRDNRPAVDVTAELPDSK